MTRVWKSYIPARIASLREPNRAGARIGYGLTRASAEQAAEHWANQAPHHREVRVPIREVQEKILSGKVADGELEVSEAVRDYLAYPGQCARPAAIDALLPTEAEALAWIGE